MLLSAVTLLQSSLKCVELHSDCLYYAHYQNRNYYLEVSAQWLLSV